MKAKTVTFRLLCTLLGITMMVCLFGCAGDGKSEEVTTTESKEEIEWLDNLSKEMDYNGLTLRAIGGDEFIPESEKQKEVVGKAKYDKRTSVLERMNLEIVNFPHDGYGNDEFRTMVESNLDECDFVLGCGAVFMPLCLENYFINMNAREEFSVISLDADWWCGEYTKEINAGNYIFWVKGELDGMLEDHPCCIFVNNSLYTVVVGASDAASEEAKIYHHVKDSTWTFDTMIELVRKAYMDDGDSELSSGDRIGFRQEGGVGLQALAYSAGATFSKRDENNIPYAAISNETNVAINEKLYDLMHLDGASEKAGSGFKGGNVLFLAESCDHAGGLREMKDDWTMIPMPKLDENQEEYISSLHWATTVAGIPITAKADLYEAIFNFWEISAAEQYRTVRPAILDDALKNKYSRDEETKEMVDLIAAGARTDFVIAYGGTTGMSSIFRENCMITRDIASTLSRKEKGVRKSLEKIVARFENASE